MSARDGPKAAGRGGLGFLGLYREHSDGEAEQREARVAQKPAAPESDLGELFVVDFCFEFGYLRLGQRHTRLSPFDRFLLRHLHQSRILLSGAPRFNELEQG